MGQRPSRTSPELFVQHNNAPPDDAQRVIRRQSGTLHDVNVENLFHARGEVITNPSPNASRICLAVFGRTTELALRLPCAARYTSAIWSRTSRSFSRPSLICR